MPIDLSQNITFLQAEPSLKNSHLITHILVYKNQEVIFFSDKALHVYSYQQMLRDQASFVHIIQYDIIFKAARQQEKGKNKNVQAYHMDEITQIFNHPAISNSGIGQKKQFGERIFSDPEDISSNILLKGEHFINRLVYLNSIRVKGVKMSIHGDLLINFMNGQSILILRDNAIRYYKSYNAVDLNGVIKDKIQQGCFISGCSNLLVFYSQKKVYVYDYLLNVLLCEIKYTCHELVNEIFAFLLPGQISNISSKESERLIVMFQHPHKLQFFELYSKKKRLISLAYFHIPNSFIESVFLYDKFFTLYAATSQTILRIDLKQLSSNHSKSSFELLNKINRSKSKSSQKSSNSTLLKKQSLLSQTIAQFQPQSPQQMLYISPSGDFIPKCKNTSKQYTNIIFQTQLGTFFAVTCKKHGNYKEGQLLIGVESDFFPEIIKKVLIQIKNLKSYEYLNFDDLSLLKENSKFKRQTVSKLSKFINETYQKFSQLDIQKGIQMVEQQSNVQVYGIQMSESQFQILLINLGYIFESKQGARQKQIEKRLIRHYQQGKGSKKNQGSCQVPQNIKQRCIFTHKEIGDESVILECKVCDIYGTKQFTDDPNVWEDGLRNGMHRCYVCMNQMCIL